jgi:hypothetical protein
VHTHRWLFAVWACFLVRGVFYCVEQPLWEGLDEWAHFAYIQRIAERGTAPQRNEAVSDEVGRSLELAPVPHGFGAPGVNYATHTEYWRLSRDERARRERELRDPLWKPRGHYVQYEAQQPPLYYFAMALPYRAMRGFGLPARVLFLRMTNLLIASLVIPLGYATARQVFAGRRIPLLVAAGLAALPGLFLWLCRVSNDALTMILTAALIYVALRILRRDAGLRDWILLGALLTAGLLAKASVVVLVPLIPLLAVLRILTRRGAGWKPAVAGSALALALAGAGAGWWYVRNWQQTGTLSGEQLEVIAARFDSTAWVAAVGRLEWLRALDTAAFTHIWIGGWSFLTVRAWMYRTFEVVAAAAAVGLVLLLARMGMRAWHRRALPAWTARVMFLVAAFALFCVALALRTVVVFLATGIPMNGGWYLYPAIVPEVILATLGIVTLARRRWALGSAAVVILLWIALDLYTVNLILIPFHTGLIGHGAVHLADVERAGGLREVLVRLAANKAALGPAAIATTWAAYLCAAIGLAALAGVAAWRRELLKCPET